MASLLESAPVEVTTIRGSTLPYQKKLPAQRVARMALPNRTSAFVRQHHTVTIRHANGFLVYGASDRFPTHRLIEYLNQLTFASSFQGMCFPVSHQILQKAGPEEAAFVRPNVR